MSQLDPVQIAALEFARGKKGKRAPRGAGSLDRDGYRMIGVGKFYEAEHRIIWRRHKGEIPKGWHVHHKDGNRVNNDIENLELIDGAEHARMHRRERAGGYVVIDGIEHKPCRECREVLPLTDFYAKPSGKSGHQSRHSDCKPCYNKKVVERKKRRLARVSS